MIILYVIVGLIVSFFLVFKNGTIVFVNNKNEVISYLSVMIVNILVWPISAALYFIGKKYLGSPYYIKIIKE